MAALQASVDAVAKRQSSAGGATATPKTKKRREPAASPRKAAQKS
jgi:hypothetical protein